MCLVLSLDSLQQCCLHSSLFHFVRWGCANRPEFLLIGSLQVPSVGPGPGRCLYFPRLDSWYHCLNSCMKHLQPQWWSVGLPEGPGQCQKLGAPREIGEKGEGTLLLLLK